MKYRFRFLHIAVVVFVMSYIGVGQVNAQRHQIFDDRISTLQVVADDDWMSLPCIPLRGDKRINVSFDDLTHTYHRYTYKLVHCEADWEESTDLFSSDYLSGITSDLTIDDYEESINTNTLYLHYSLTIPNKDCRITMSGNYRLDVIDDESGDVILSAKFYVYEPLVNISASVLDNTDIDIRSHSQQIALSINYPSSLGITDARSQLKVAVMQNMREDNIVWCPPAPIMRPGVVEWTHVRQLIFPAGNEYHKYEFFDPHRNSMGVESVRWDGEQYHTHLFHDYVRRAYVYDEDANGAFLIRNSDNVENDYTTDYSMVHFYLDTPQLDGEVYLDGRWTYNSLSEKYLMEYDEEQSCYHLAIPLKYGYYSYQYLFLPYEDMKNTPRDVMPSLTRFTEGDFYQTENRYNILVYYRPNGGRTWRLVGVGENGKR